MNSFITDSLFIKKQYPDFTFVSQAFIWKVKTFKNEIEVKKENIYNLDTEFLSFTGIISQSNYRLQYELLDLNKETRFYSPENFEKRIPYGVNFKVVEKAFSNYLKRGFISYLNYEHLKNIGLKRIEQFVLMLSTIATQNIKSIDNIQNSPVGTVVSYEKFKTEKINLTGIQLLKFITVLNKYFRFSFEELSKYLIKEYSKLTITDPFDENGFFFLKNENEEIFDIAKSLEFINLEIDIYKCSIKDEKGKIKVIYIKKAKEDISEHLIDYLQLQKDDYFIGKFINPSKEVNSILLLEQTLKEIMPLKDFVLTLKLLLKLKKIIINDLYLYVEESNIPILKPKSNASWINKNIWKEIYDSVSFNFSTIIDPVDITNKAFKCPLCGEEHYTISPLKIFCGNKKCGFKFLRKNLTNFGVDRVSIESIVESLNNEGIMIKNNKNKNLSAFIEQKGKTFYLSIKY